MAMIMKRKKFPRSKKIKIIQAMEKSSVVSRVV
jgi:hypothetical protein